MATQLTACATPAAPRPPHAAATSRQALPIPITRPPIVEGMMPEFSCGSALLQLVLDAPALGADRAIDDLALAGRLGVLAGKVVDAVLALLPFLRPLLVLHVLLLRLAALRKGGERRRQTACKPAEDPASR